MLKYMIRSDIEGASGVVSYVQAEPWQAEYADGRRYFMSDILAAVHGLLDGGADEVYIYDEHCYGRNVLMDELPENVFVYNGKPPYRPDWCGGIDESFAGMLMVGFHSKADRELGNLLHHTYDKDLKNIDINGLSVGEIGNEAAMAGDVGVPLVMVTGDSAGIEEAKALCPDVVGVSVKGSVSEYGGLCLPISVTHKMIYDAAKKIAADQKAEPEKKFFKPLKIEGPVKMKIDFFDTPLGKAYHDKFGEAYFEGENVLTCWSQWQEKRAQVEV